MRVLWISDGGCYTGFAKVTHEIGERLVKQYGHEVWVLATNYNGDYWDTPLKMFVPTTISPSDTYGEARMLELAAKLGAEAIVMVHDQHLVYHWLLQNRYDGEHMLARNWSGRFLFYTPLDGENYPPLWDSLGVFGRRIAMSKHGQRQMEGSALVYHGVDTEKYWPVSSQHPIVLPNGEKLRSKRDCKKKLGYEATDFVIGRVDSNSGRKDFPALWSALIPVMKRHADVHAYWLTSPGGYDGGVTMTALWSREMELSDRFKIPESYSRKRGPVNGWSELEMNVVYNAFDLFVSTSRGEGFGLTLAEALACGVPVIAQNVSAIPEVVGPGGILVEPQRRITVPMGQDQWLPDIEGFTAAIERAYRSRAWRRDAGIAGREHVSTSFRWDDAAAAFDTLLGEVQANAAKDSADAAEAG